MREIERKARRKGPGKRLGIVVDTSAIYGDLRRFPFAWPIFSTRVANQLVLPVSRLTSLVHFCVAVDRFRRESSPTAFASFPLTSPPSRFRFQIASGFSANFTFVSHFFSFLSSLFISFSLFSESINQRALVENTVSAKIEKFWLSIGKYSTYQWEYHSTELK